MTAMLKTAALLAIGLLSQSGGVFRQAERAVERDLAVLLNAEPKNVHVKAQASSLLGPLGGHWSKVQASASSFRVDGMPFMADPSRNAAGRVDLLQIDLSDFFLRELHVDSLSAKIPDCRYDLDLALSKRAIRFHSSGEGRGTVVTDAEALSDYALKRFPMLTKAKITLLNGWVVFEGSGTLLWTEADFWVSGQLELANRRQIVLKPRRFLINGRRVEGKELEAWQNALTPLLDVDLHLGLAGAMDLEKIAVTPKSVAVSGPIRIPKAP